MWSTVRHDAPRMPLAVICLAAASCTLQVDVGSDLLWTARFEGGTFDEWTGVPGGSASASPATSTIELSSERVHSGQFAAKLTISPGADGVQVNTGLARNGDLPTDAYYSAWYYLPRTVTVSGYWLLMKFRRRMTAADPASETELFDIRLENLPSGEMTTMVYDHRVARDLAMSTAEVVPVGRWFMLEAFYRSANDASGRLTLWLDGSQIFDQSGPTGPNSWLAWDVVNVGTSLSPTPVTVYVDDCAISGSPVGPGGLLAK